MNEIELPSYWKIINLEKICKKKPQNGAFIKKPEWDEGTIFVNVKDTYRDVVVNLTKVKRLKASLEDVKKYGLKVGDLLFVRSSLKREGIGQCCLIETLIEPAIFDCHLIRISTIKEIAYPLYIAYFFLSEPARNDLIARSKTTTMTTINQQGLIESTIPLPPLPEQKSIAQTLRTIQKAKQTRQRELELERERKAALMQYLFTHGTRNEALQQTEIGEIPESWDVVKLESLLREPLKNGHSAPASNSKEGIRTLILTAVTKNNFSIKNTKLTQANADKVKNLWLEPGDIFIERANTYEMVGLAALYEGETNFAIYPDLMVRVRVKQETIFPKYLVEFFLTPMCRAYFKKNASGTAASMPKIDQGVIRRVNILLPSYEEQKEIVEISRSCDRKISSLEKEIAILDELFHAMLEQLMTGKISTKHLSEIHL
ncbi:restriction endonuclease S subunit [Rivularia sp. PCC 7116]|uniref:restriction endonuclease subunit S n=1 Tax=Rivularia sp. PCC 7116 TaxID=373994 RepID=UPI00029EFCAC|nr:restriction endonuclease subunit S [Rivularia sp. PCC 7116]AFY57436.1 restriction endonuclease S subunit [Rivularia sp. PCC 7116]